MRIYLDSSAIIKRVLQEDESEALVAMLDSVVSEGQARLYTSELAWVEVSRAIRARSDSEPPRDVVDSIDAALSGISGHPISDAVINIARRLGGPQLRSLDAIHLATTTLIDADLVVAYDERLIQSANELGFVTRSPGR